MNRHVRKSPGNQRTRQSPTGRAGEVRSRLAQEAARLMAEGGIRDYHQAKVKAAARLGISDDAALPRNQEVDDALREYQRLFQPDNIDLVRRRREAAVQGLEFFGPFEPRLVGPVLDGTADAYTPVSIHLHTDDADAAASFLEQHGIPAETSTRRLRLDRERSGMFPAWTFRADDVAFDLTVLPRDVLRQAPVSAIDQKPVKRASLVQLRQLLLDEGTGSEANWRS